MAKKFKAITEEKIVEISTFSLQKIDLLKIVFSSPASKKDKSEGGIKISGYFGYLEGIPGNLKNKYPSTRLMIKSMVAGIKDTTATLSKRPYFV